MENTKKFNPSAKLRRTKPVTILKWAIGKVNEKLAAVQKINAERIGNYTDNEVMSKLGKRDKSKLEKGKTTLDELRTAMVAKANAVDAKDAEKAIADLTAGFGDALPYTILVDVDWKKSRTWGMNPNATVYAHSRTESGSVGGCGFDKESTATAIAFRDNPVFARIAATCAWLDEMETKATGKPCKTYGYHVGYTGFRFDGGVGYSCHDTIIRRAGYKSEAESHGKLFDGYKYTKI